MIANLKSLVSSDIDILQNPSDITLSNPHFNPFSLSGDWALLSPRVGIGTNSQGANWINAPTVKLGTETFISVTAAPAQARDIFSYASFVGATGANVGSGVRSSGSIVLSQYSHFTKYKVFLRFGKGDNRNNTRGFVGICAAANVAFAGSATIASDPSGSVELFGIGYDNADLSSGNWSLYHNGASGNAVKTELTLLPRNTTDFIDLLLEFDPASTSYTVTVWRLAGNPSTSTLITRTQIYNAVVTGSLPSTGQAIGVQVATSNGSATGIGSSTLIEKGWVFRS